MPVRVDHDQRRRHVAAAVWRVLARTGFAGLGLRAVAAELGATTGLLTHYFPDKRALVVHALDVLHERTDQRLGPGGAPGLAGLRARLRAVMPTSPEDAELSRVWVGFWDVALADPALTDLEAARYQRWRDRLRPFVLQAQARGELAPADPRVVIDTLTAFTHGLVVQALFDPDRFPPARQHEALDAVLRLLAPPAET